MSTRTATDHADFYELEALLDADEQEYLHSVRDFMKSDVEPTESALAARQLPGRDHPGVPAARTGRAALSRIRLCWKVIPA